ncbi:MAG: hypothetical protein LUD76_10280 [Alistipes sp.]|nr:hypothetical protein [Alistipes sp.]
MSGVIEIETVMVWVEEFLLQFGLIVAAYFLAVVAVLLDLRSGIHKAKLRGEFRRSLGFRRTFLKFNQYGNSLLILTVIDFMQMVFIKALNGQIAVNFPVLPVATFVGCLGVCIVEYRSIKENAEDKTKIEEVEQVATKLVTELAKNQHLFQQVLGLLKRNDYEQQQRFTQQQPGQYPNIHNPIQGGSDPLAGPGL